MEILPENSRNATLSDDLIYEILLRVSLDTLERCRLASKKINTYTQSQLFLNSFYRRNDIYSGCITQQLARRTTHVPAAFFQPCPYQEKKRNNLSLSFLPKGGVKVKVCSNAGGLFYCRSMNARGAWRANYMCKPTTKQWVAIPNHKTIFKTEAYAVVVKKAQPLTYSIFRFSKSPNQDPSECTMFCEIFDSTTWLWRRAEDVKFEKSISLAKKEATTTYLKGAVHFLTCSQEIFAFDITTEKWALKPFPQQIVRKPDGKRYRHKLSQTRGNLKLSELRVYTEESEYVQTWNMVDYSKAAWTKGCCCLREGYTVALSHHDNARWVYEKTPNDGSSSSSYAEVKADGTNALYFIQMLPFASDYEPVILKPSTTPQRMPQADN